MDCRALWITALLLAAVLPAAAQTAPRVLTGWGIDEKNLEPFLAEAAATGFDALITWNTDPAALGKIVAAADKHRISIFSCISPMGGIGSSWQKRYPERPVPWQVLSADEEAARRFLAAGNNQFLVPYQFGGEPALANEVLLTKIICFSDPEARELLKPVIDGIAGVPGIAGLAFDGFGYQNYRCCRCERCQAALAQYRNGHPELAAQEAEKVFFRDLLVSYVNSLAGYARSRRADLKTAAHLWPVFAPEPLYGNRLDIDYCGQTAAWYVLWPEQKMAEYSRLISGEARRYYPRQEGVGMIGYYDKPGQFPVKDAARVDLELRTMLDNGCRHIQVCSTLDVLRNKPVAEVFRKYFGQ